MITDQDIEKLKSVFATRDEMHGMMQEMLRAIGLKFDEIDTRFDRVEARLDKIEVRLDKIEVRLDQVELRLERVEGKIMDIVYDLKNNVVLRKPLLVHDHDDEGYN